jgi:hypothetical protein
VERVPGIDIALYMGAGGKKPANKLREVRKNEKTSREGRGKKECNRRNDLRSE